MRQEFPKEHRGVGISLWLLMTMGRYGSVSPVVALAKKLTFIMFWAAKPSVVSRR
jgi:hypothetical protein